MEREQTWIRAIQRRNSREAAEQLIQTYYDEIYRFVYRQTGSKEDAMDLTQSVFIAVLRALPGYRAERASFRTWLYRIAANKVIDTRRKARPVSIPIQEMELPAAEDFVAASMTGPCWRPSKAMSPAWTPGSRRCSACGSTGKRPSRRSLPPWESRRRQ